MCGSRLFMSDSRQKQGNHWCEICKCWVSNHIMTIRAHEMSSSHQRKAKLSMLQMRAKDAQKQENKKSLDAELNRVNTAVAGNILRGVDTIAADKSEIQQILQKSSSSIGPQLGPSITALPPHSVRAAPVYKISEVPKRETTPLIPPKSLITEKTIKMRHSTYRPHVVDYESMIAPDSPSSTPSNSPKSNFSPVSAPKRTKCIPEPPISENSKVAPEIGPWIPVVASVGELGLMSHIGGGGSSSFSDVVINSSVFGNRMSKAEEERALRDLDRLNSGALYSVSAMDSESTFDEIHTAENGTEKQQKRKKKSGNHEIWGSSLDW